MVAIAARPVNLTRFAYPQLVSPKGGPKFEPEKRGIYHSRLKPRTSAEPPEIDSALSLSINHRLPGVLRVLTESKASTGGPGDPINPNRNTASFPSDDSRFGAANNIVKLPKNPQVKEPQYVNNIVRLVRKGSLVGAKAQNNEKKLDSLNQFKEFMEEIISNPISLEESTSLQNYKLVPNNQDFCLLYVDVKKSGVHFRKNLVAFMESVRKLNAAFSEAAVRNGIEAKHIDCSFMGDGLQIVVPTHILPEVIKPLAKELDLMKKLGIDARFLTANSNELEIRIASIKAPDGRLRMAVEFDEKKLKLNPENYDPMRHLEPEKIAEIPTAEEIPSTQVSENIVQHKMHLAKNTLARALTEIRSGKVSDGERPKELFFRVPRNSAGEEQFATGLLLSVPSAFKGDRAEICKKVLRIVEKIYGSEEQRYQRLKEVFPEDLPLTSSPWEVTTSRYLLVGTKKQSQELYMALNALRNSSNAEELIPLNFGIHTQTHIQALKVLDTEVTSMAGKPVQIVEHEIGTDVWSNAALALKGDTAKREFLNRTGFTNEQLIAHLFSGPKAPAIGFTGLSPFGELSQLSDMHPKAVSRALHYLLRSVQQGDFNKLSIARRLREILNSSQSAPLVNAF